MRRMTVCSAAIGSIVLGVAFLAGPSPAAAQECPGPPDSFSWGKCIGANQLEPNGQTVREATAEVVPSLSCVKTSVQFESSGPKDWCRTYTLTVDNQCGAGLRFDLPALVGTPKAKRLGPGKSAEIAALPSCVAPADVKSGHTTDAGIDVSTTGDTGGGAPDAATDTGSTVSDATGDTGADSGDTNLDTGVDTSSDTGVDTGTDTGIDAGDTGMDTVQPDTVTGDTGGPDGDATANSVCALYDHRQAPGVHVVDYSFTHMGKSYDLRHEVQTDSLEEWYEANCTSEMTSDAGDAAGTEDVGEAEPTDGETGGDCGCRAAPSGVPPLGGLLLFVFALVGLRWRRSLA